MIQFALDEFALTETDRIRQSAFEEARIEGCRSHYKTCGLNEVGFALTETDRIGIAQLALS